MDTTSIRIFQKDIPRINILRHQIKDKAMSQPELISFLLDEYHDKQTNQK